VLRDIAGESTGRIIIDSRENFQKLQEFAAEYMPKVLEKLEHYTGERPLFDLYNVEDEIERALARRVELKSGGYLILEQTEAMTRSTSTPAATWAPVVSTIRSSRPISRPHR